MQGKSQPQHASLVHVLDTLPVPSLSHTVAYTVVPAAVQAGHSLLYIAIRVGAYTR